MSKIWFPFSQEALDGKRRKIISAKGASLFDQDGKEYIDLISSWWTNVHGHCHPKISSAISRQARQLDHVMFSDFTHAQAEALCDKLDILTNQNFGKFFFSDNGSTSTEVAIKIAHQYWKNIGIITKNTVISFKGGYHGDTLGAMSAGRMSGYCDHFEDLMPEFCFVDYPATWEGDSEVDLKENVSIEQLKSIILDKKTAISSMIIEPLCQGASGMNMCRASFVDKVVNICKENNIIVIFDEVMTGFYRTGRAFAYNYLSVLPDILCLSKGITGGFLPLGITAVRQEVYDKFYSRDINKSFLHGHSYTGNPICCAAANASLELMLNSNFPRKIQKIDGVYKALFSLLLNNKNILRARQIGTILAFDLTKTFDYGSPDSVDLKLRFLDEGLNIRPLGSTVYFMPPYCISSSVLKDCILRTLKVIESGLR